MLDKLLIGYLQHKVGCCWTNGCRATASRKHEFSVSFIHNIYISDDVKDGALPKEIGGSNSGVGEVVAPIY